MSQILFQCYVCNQELQVGADKAGRKAKCIQCGTVLTIPSGPAEELESPVPASPTPLPPTRVPPSSSPEDDIQEDLEEEPVPRRREEREAMPEDRAPERDEEDRPRRRRDLEDDRDYEDRGYEDRGYEDRGYADRPRASRREERRDADYDRPRRRRDEYEDRGRDDYDDYEDRAKTKKWKSQWPRVRLGMLLGLIGMGVMGLGFLFELIGAFILFVNSMSLEGLLRGPEGFPHLVALIGNILFFLGMGCLLAGQVFWIFITNKHGGLVWAIVCLSVGGVAFLLFLIFRLVPLFGPNIMPYGHWIYFRVSGLPGMGMGRVSVHVANAILPVLVLIFISVHGMMTGFYMRCLGKTLRDTLVASRGMQIIITAITSAAYQLIWPFIGYAFISSTAMGQPTTGGMIGIWIFYFGGVLALALLYGGQIITLNMGRIITDT